MSYELISIIISLVSIFIAIYIAYRNGIFNTTSFEVIPGIMQVGRDPLSRNIIKHGIWAVICGIPFSSRVKNYLSIVPISIRNNGKTPIKDVLIQFSFDIELLNEEAWLNQLKKLTSTKEVYNYGIEAHIKHFGDRCFIEYVIPSIPRRINYPIYAFFVKEIKGEIKHNKVEIYISSPDFNKPINLSFWLILCNAKDELSLKHNTKDILFKLHKQNCPDFPFKKQRGLIWAPYPWKFFYKRYYPDCKLNKRFVYLRSDNFGSLKDPLKEKEIDLIVQDILSTKATVYGFDEKGLPVKGFDFI